MSTAAQEVKVLEGRLAAAKEKAAKESNKDTLAARLAAAHEAINSGERKLNLVQHKVRNLESAIPEAERASRSGDVSVDARESARIRYFDLKNENEKLNLELGSIRESLDGARSDLTNIHAKISAHPVFAGARNEQREICQRAVELARDVWSGALTNAASLHAQLERLSRDEQAAIGRWRSKLDEAGLPKLAPRIYSQLGNLIPSIFLTLDLPRLRADAESAAARVLGED